ncbi:sugar kinase [Arthrobacter russicus]|jgi:2-dehydro-3-deoxygluconokinase
MAVLSPDPPVGLAAADRFSCGIGGAESNVAMGLAAFGVPVSWISRLGEDGFGRKILAALAQHGVDVAQVQIDRERPTGLYFKDPAAEPEHSVRYYRQGSAAAAMAPDLLADPAVAALLAGAGLVHLSGITPALSPSCRALCEQLLRLPRDGRVFSFDLNWRPGLWHGQDASLLRGLADSADVLLLGADEAEQAFGTGSEAELRTLLPGPETLVLKKAADSAVSLHRDPATGRESRTEVPALSVALLEPVGAGDSFAAGYLSGLLAGLDETSRLRRGHLAAACTLTVAGDRGALPEEAVIEALLGSSEAQWRATSVAPGRIESPALPAPAVLPGRPIPAGSSVLR